MDERGNPPFSTKAWSNGFDPANDLFKRFAFGIPPQKNGDYAFLLHILASLKSHGKGAVILPHGVLFRGGAEDGQRQIIVEQRRTRKLARRHRHRAENQKPKPALEKQTTTKQCPPLVA